MNTSALDTQETGLEVVDFGADEQFASRPLRARDGMRQFEMLQRLAEAFLDRPETMLDELVNAAIELCGADSAGISIEKPERGDEKFYHWVATAGVYAGFLDAELPRNPSACGVTLATNKPQHFRVTPRFFEILGVEAPVVSDGILLPWVAGSTRGTIFVMAHNRQDAFDRGDLRVMTILANFAAMAVRHRAQQDLLLKQAEFEAEVRMARELAHKFNNPLQSLTNGVFLTNAGGGRTTSAVAQGMTQDVDRLSNLVRDILKLPKQHVN